MQCHRYLPPSLIVAGSVHVVAIKKLEIRGEQKKAVEGGAGTARVLEEKGLREGLLLIFRKKAAEENFAADAGGV